MANYSLSIFLGGLIMSRIFFVVRNYELYFNDFTLSTFLGMFYIWDKGLSPWGGVIGILLSLIYFARKEGESIKKWLDVVSVSIIGAITFSNIGAFLDGRNYGNETELPWGILVESSIYAVPIHPVQIYAALYSGILTVTLYQLFNNKISKEPGNISLLALGGYSFFTILEEFLRGDESHLIFEFREVQIYALLGLLTAIILFLIKKQHLTKKNDGNVQ